MANSKMAVSFVKTKTKKKTIDKGDTEYNLEIRKRNDIKQQLCWHCSLLAVTSSSHCC